MPEFLKALFLVLHFFYHTLISSWWCDSAFSVIDGFVWFWMESLYNNIQLMLEFLKGPFLVLHLSCCILMTFLMMLSVILLSMLMILLSIRTVLRHLIYGSNLNRVLKLNLIYKTLWTGAGSGLFISILEKLNRFCLTSLITLLLLMWKWMSLCLRKNNLLNCLGWLSLLNCIGAVTLSELLKLPPRILKPWFIVWNFFLLRLLCISINVLHSHVWNIVVMPGLLLLGAAWDC